MKIIYIWFSTPQLEVLLVLCCFPIESFIWNQRADTLFIIDKELEHITTQSKRSQSKPLADVAHCKVIMGAGSPSIGTLWFQIRGKELEKKLTRLENMYKDNWSHRIGSQDKE